LIDFSDEVNQSPKIPFIPQPADFAPPEGFSRVFSEVSDIPRPKTSPWMEIVAVKIGSSFSGKSVGRGM